MHMAGLQLDSALFTKVSSYCICWVNSRVCWQLISRELEITFSHTTTLVLLINQIKIELGLMIINLSIFRRQLLLVSCFPICLFGLFHLL